MEQGTFLELDTEVYDTLLWYLPDKTVELLKQVSTDTRSRVTGVTGSDYYWLRKLSTVLGMEVTRIPQGITPKELYEDVTRPGVEHALGTLKLYLMVFHRGGRELASRLLVDSAKTGMINIVKFLLRNYENLPADDAVIASADCHPDVAIFLLSNTQIKTQTKLRALPMASCSGRTRVVELLLSDPLVDVPNSWSKLDSIRLAAERGYADVLRLLLRDGITDPDFNHGSGTPIEIASSRGRLDVVRVLLSSPLVSAQSVSNALDCARNEGVVELLMQDRR